TPGIDYDIDYLQGRLLLSEPLTSTADDHLLVRDAGLRGEDAYLVVRYEYSPGFEELDALSVGGQGHYWFGERVKVGLTANRNDQGTADSALRAADVTVRIKSDSWFKLQEAHTEGLITSATRSVDGGFGFAGYDDAAFSGAEGGGYRADLSVGLNDLFDNAKGRVTLYSQDLEAGYAAPGLATPSELRNYGGTFRMPVTSKLAMRVKADRRVQEQGLTASAQELDVEYNSKARWSAYGCVQDTLDVTGNREENGRVGTGGSYRISDKLRINAEVSNGDLGPGGKIGTRYMPSERTTVYVNYALENERTDNGLLPTAGGEGSMIAGVKTRLSGSSSVYVEERYRSGYMSGLTHATGVSLAPTQRLNLGASTDVGTLRDMQTGAETKRRAAGVNMGYGFSALQFSSGVEYRSDESEQPDLTFTRRKTWLFRSSFKYQATPDVRVLGKVSRSDSTSSLGDFYAGGYTEAVLGFAYRPVRNDRLNVLTKYTYFFNMPTTDQVTLKGTRSEFLQKSRVAAFDLTYALTPTWSLGGKYAHRIGEMSLTRDTPQFFDNAADLFIVRADFRFKKDWEGMLEGRLLDLPDSHDQRAGNLVVISRYLNKHLKADVGYNFTDFSDDLTDLSFDHRGVFISMTGAM